MEQPKHLGQARDASAASLLPVSVIVAARNEARNLPRCLQALLGFAEVFVIDSQSADATVEVARNHGAQVVQFYYHGGWPKKRQWAMDTLPLAQDWILLLDADEAMTPELADEVREAIQNPDRVGYYISLQQHFLGRHLKHSGASLWKLALFRRGKGHFECRLREQDTSMADMEVHEHVVVEGRPRDCEIRSFTTTWNLFLAIFKNTTSIPTGKRKSGSIGRKTAASCLRRYGAPRRSGGDG